MQARGVATKTTASEIVRLHGGGGGPHMLAISLEDSETIAIGYFLRLKGIMARLASGGDTYKYDQDSGYDGDGSTQSFSGQSLSTPVAPGSVVVPATAGSPKLNDEDRDGVLYAQDVAARKVGASGSFAQLASESFVVKIDGGASQTITMGTEATIAAAVVTINSQLLDGVVSAADANNINISSNSTGKSSTVQVVSADSGVTTKLGISAGTATNNMGSVDYFTGALALSYTNGFIPSPGGTADPATLTGSVAGPTFDLDPGDTLIVDVNNTGNKTATFDAAAATHSGQGGTFAASNSETMTLAVDGGEEQTVTLGAGTETTLATYIAKLNTQMAGCYAVANGTSLGGAIGVVNETKADWNAHCANATSHTNADAVNTTAAADATDQATAITLANELKADMNAHFTALSELEEAITLVNELKADYNLHVAELSTLEEAITLVNEIKADYNAHATGVSTLEEAITLVNEIKADYNAHRVDLTSHSLANTTDATTSADATDLASAQTLANELKTDYNNHRTDTNEDSHPTDDDTNVVTAANASDLATLVTLANDLLTQYEAHRASASFHLAADTTNVVSAPAAETNAIHLIDGTVTTSSADATDLASAQTLANEIKADFNDHRTDVTDELHPTDDDTNAIAAADATDLASLLTLLNELKTDINAHMASATFHVNADSMTITSDNPGTAAIHSVDNTTDVTSSADATDLASAQTLANELKTDYNNHRTDTNEDSHPTDDDTNVVTAANASDLDTLSTLLTDIKTQYNAHIANTGGAWHPNADATNTITSDDVQTSAIHEQDDTANAIAAADATDLASLLTLVAELKADYNLHRVQASVHDANDTTNVVSRTTDSIDIVSDTKGTGASIQVVSGDVDFLEKTGIRAGTASGTGDVVDINAVTISEIETVVEADVKTASPGDLITVTNDGSDRVKLTTVATGTSAEIDISASNVATALGLSLTPTVGVAATADPVNLLVGYVQGQSMQGPGRFVDIIPNFPENAELVIYGVSQSGSCRVSVQLEQMTS